MRYRRGSNEAIRRGACEVILFDRCWQGQPAYILGNGDSRWELDLSRLDGRRVIGCNVACFTKSCDLTVVMDLRVIQRVGSGLRNCSHEVVMPWAGDMADVPVGIRGIKGTHPTRWSDTLDDGVLLENNVGLSALNLACIAGADPIVLIGFDMKPTKDGLTSNPAGLYPADYRTHAEDCYAEMRRAWERWAPEAKKRARIVNVNAESGLRCFEFGDFEAITA